MQYLTESEHIRNLIDSINLSETNLVEEFVDDLLEVNGELLAEMELDSYPMDDHAQQVAQEYGLSQRSMDLLYTWDEKTSYGQTKLFQENISDFLELAKSVSEPYEKPVFRGLILKLDDIVNLITNGSITLKPMMPSESWGIGFGLARAFLYHRLDSGHPRVPKPGEGIVIEDQFSASQQIIWTKAPRLYEVANALDLYGLRRQITAEEEILIHRTQPYQVDLTQVRYITARHPPVIDAAKRRWPHSSGHGSFTLNNGEISG